MERPETKTRFFIEEHPENLGGEPRHQVLSRILNPGTCQFLEDRGWGVAIAMIELDRETGQLLKNISQKFPNLAISAWIVVDDKDGYWTNRFNVCETRAKVEKVKAWANRFDIPIEALGFDLEPPLQLALTIPRKDLKGLISQILLIQRGRIRQIVAGYSPEQDMQDLLKQLKGESVTTHSYEMPQPLSTRFLGVLSNKGFDTRVTMVYSTQGLPAAFERQIPSLLLRKGTYPAIGVYSSTRHNPGRDFGSGDHSRVNERVLKRDIRTLIDKSKGKKSSVLNNLWVFALTDIQVAKWTEEALQSTQRSSPKS